MLEGCHTALITPMRGERGEAVDYEGLERLVRFQVDQGISGVLATGTTGESPTLNWREHTEVIRRINEFAAGACTVIGGTGSNSTEECLVHTQEAVEHGVSNILLVDPYYNGPSSLEIRREYVEPLALEFPDVQFIPYVIPGRSGTQLLPEDLAILHGDLPNVPAVKEATGDLDNMRRTREVCGTDFEILSGDDGLTHAMMSDTGIAACGVISVASNVAPAAVQRMVLAHLAGDAAKAERLADALAPLFGIVTIKTQEDSPYGPRLCKARNPLPIKTLMRLLDMPSGPVRRPLGRMTVAGFEVLLGAARTIWERDPWILRPVAEAFDVDIEEQLSDSERRAALIYSE